MADLRNHPKLVACRVLGRMIKEDESKEALREELQGRILDLLFEEVADLDAHHAAEERVLDAAADLADELLDGMLLDGAREVVQRLRTIRYGLS